MTDTEAFDREVRLHIYRRLLEEGSPPSPGETARAVNASPAEVEAAYRRLAEGHAIVLQPGTVEVVMANPLSAVPTPFRVTVADRSWWGSCAWDALGVGAMLGADATIASSCPDCGEPLMLSVEEGSLVPAEGTAHFQVPAARWWDDIVFT